MPTATSGEMPPVSPIHLKKISKVAKYSLSPVLEDQASWRGNESYRNIPISGPVVKSAPVASMVCHFSNCVRPATRAAGGVLIDRYPGTHYRRRKLPDYVDQGDPERWNLPKV